MEEQIEIYEAKIARHYCSNGTYFGSYMSFHLTPESEQLEGFIMSNNMNLSKTQRERLLDNQTPNHLKVGKTLKVKIVNTDGHYYDLCVV